MNRFIAWIFSFFLMLAFVQVSAAETANEKSEAYPSEITIGLLPGGNPNDLKRQGLVLGELLQAAMGLPVKIYISKSYEGMTEALKNKSVDFAFMSALSFVKADPNIQLKVLLKKVWQDPFYYSALITLKSSKIKSISQIKGKKVVFVDESSTSGYLYPMAALIKNNLNPTDIKHVEFSGNHSNSLIALEEGKADVAAVFSDDKDGHKGAWTKFGKLKSTDYRILWMSDAIPTDPFVVRSEFYESHPKFVHDLMFKMIDVFEENSANSEITKLLGSKAMVPATTRQYDSVRDVFKLVFKK